VPYRIEYGVRATTSGDGCGGHWPTCNGQIIPRIGRIATVIEFSHRISSGLLLPLILLLVAAVAADFLSPQRAEALGGGAIYKEVTLTVVVTPSPVGAFSHLATVTWAARTACGIRW